MINNPVGPPSKPATNSAAPTLGAVLGSVLGGVIAAKTGLATDPGLGVPLVSGITGLVTGLFHWLGTKIGADW
jgi:hypothetical protein